MSDNRSSVVNLSRRIALALGPGANHGRMARIAEAWDRSTAPGETCGVQSRAQAYVFNVFGWLAEAARS
jgi:hypothetical protein